MVNINMNFISFRKFLLEKATAFSMIAQGLNKAATNILDKTGINPFRVTRGNKGEVRLQPIKRGDPIDPALVNKILDHIGHSVDRVVDPGHPDAKSSKFPTRWTRSGIPVVIGSGGPKGLKHEEDVAGEIQGIIDHKGGSDRALNLIKSIGLNPDDIEKIIHVSGKAARRPLQARPQNVGPTIADITLLLKDGQKQYISLKDPHGDTFGNFGIAGSFTMDSTTKEVKIHPHPTDVLLQALGIDKDLVKDGLQAYINKLPNETLTDTSPPYDKNAIKGYLESAYGYGYWYAKAKGKDEWEIKDLHNLEDLNRIVGDVRVIKVTYPGKYKQAVAVVVSSVGDRYQFEVRNSKGGIIPTEIKVKRVGKIKQI